MSKHPPKLPFGTLAFEVTVNYNQSLEEMIKNSGFENKLPSKSERKIFGEGQQKRRLFLIPAATFPNTFLGTKGLKLIQEVRLVPGRLEDLLALVRDHRAQITQKDVHWVAAFGTNWQSDGEDWSPYALFDYKELRSGRIVGQWGGSRRGYFLAAAEDGVKRKIHKTPYLGSSYLPHSFSPAGMLSLPRALMVTVEVDYRKTVAEMMETAGFKELQPTKEIIGVPPISKIPIHSGNSNPKSQQKVKRTLVLVPLVSLTDDDVTVSQISKWLAKHGLTPARAEDLLTLTPHDRGHLSSNHNVRRLMAFGSDWIHDNTKIGLRVDSWGDLRIGPLDESGWDPNHWVLCYPPKPQKQSNK